MDKLEEARKEIDVALKAEATAIRDSRMANGEYIGLIRIVDDSINPIQVQFRITGGAIDVEQEPLVDTLYGSARETFFKKALEVKIMDLDATAREAIAKGASLNDHLKVSVKSGHDEDLNGYTSVEKMEALQPVENFLNNSNDLKKTFNEKTKAFHDKYLAEVLTPVVSAGNKG